MALQKGYCMYKIFTLLLLAATGYALMLSDTPKNSSLVIYNSNLALVHEIKALAISPKESEIIYPDVARSIITNSVSLTLPHNITLYAQKYRYDKLTRKKLLDAYIGKKIRYKDTSPTLLAHQAQEALIRLEDGSVATVATQDISFPSIPSELIIQPSLVWNVKVFEKLQQDIALSYLIQHIRWSSDYVLHIEKEHANLTGWITIDNKSGKAFHNTQLYLLAGAINRAKPQTPPLVRAMKTAVMADGTAVTQKAHEGYHIYHVPFRVTLANNEKTQIKFLTKNNLPLTRSYSAYLDNPIYLRTQKQTNVSQYIEFQKLDVPLPQGVVRTYSAMQKTDILLGEHLLQHTPKNTPVKLKIGTNFDIKVTQTPLQRDQNQKFLFANIRYTVHNNSDEAKKVTLLIPFNTNKGSQIQTDKSFRFTKGNLATFTLEIGANSSLSFNVHFQSKR